MDTIELSISAQPRLRQAIAPQPRSFHLWPPRPAAAASSLVFDAAGANVRKFRVQVSPRVHAALGSRAVGCHRVGRVDHSDRTRPVAIATGAMASTQTRLIQSVRPDEDGRFAIRALPPVEYYVVALEYVETGQEFDPEQLAVWKTLATTVEVGEGDTKTKSLNLAR